MALSSYFGIAGASVIALASLLLSRGYSVYVKRRAAEYSAYLSFLELMRREISCALCTPREIGARASSSVLFENGFIGALRSGDGLLKAFCATEEASLMSLSDRKALAEYFEGFGLGSLDTELRALDLVISEISKREREEREGASSRIKLAVTLLVLFAAAVTVLLI